jgi:hypothetical protein
MMMKSDQASDFLLVKYLHFPGCTEENYEIPEDARHWRRLEPRTEFKRSVPPLRVDSFVHFSGIVIKKHVSSSSSAKVDGMSGACSALGGNERCVQNFGSET